MSEIINLIPQNPDVHVYHEALEIVKNKISQDFSFIIQTWNGSIMTETKHKKVLVLTSDEAHQTPKHINYPDVAHVFKQYAPMSNMRDYTTVKNVDRVTPIPLCHLKGVKNLGVPIPERQYDWCWMGQFDPYQRVDFKMAIDALAHLNETKYRLMWYDGWNNGVHVDEYNWTINNTKIIFAPTGSASLETFRFYEGMMSGCMVISIKQPNVSFYDKAPYIKVREWNEILPAVTNILNDLSVIEKYSSEAQDWYNKHCSPEGLAEYMMKALENIDV
tara:strand:- start:3938 stop:4762 length:825 start_codon:yes stop_codon:yes gene_type:complete